MEVPASPPASSTEVRREASLLKTGALQDAIFQSANFSCIATDEKGVIQLFNVGAERMLGYAASDVIDRITPADLSDPNELVTRARVLTAELGTPIAPGFEALVFKATRGIEDVYELTYVRRDGTRLAAVVSVTALRNIENTILGYLLIGTDNTARKRLDEALHEKNVELAKATALAEKANRAKSDFLANMSHEIRTPMNAILGMADLLWETPLAGDQREYVRVFRKAGGQLLMLIDDILDLSKVESGQLALETLRFDLGEMLDRTLQMMAGRAREKGLELIVRIAPDVPRDLIGDPGRLRQVIVNLVGNAIKFTRVGRVTVDVARDPADPTPGSLRFTVADTGIGMPADARELVFAPYTQVDSSTTRRFGGTGLGLTICRRLVELMQGRIWAESDLGVGSTFSFTIRLATGDARTRIPPLSGGADETEAPVPPLAGAAALNILLVEDSADNVALFQAYLKASGCVADVACDGGLALEKFRSKRYDLVLMDVQIPVMDGYATARAMRERERETGAAPVPLVALTAHALPEDAGRSIDAGCTAHLTKPIRKSAFLAAVEEHALKRVRVRVDASLAPLMPAFIANRHLDAVALAAACDAGRFEDVRIIGHNMKGSGSGYGLVRISEIGDGLELAARRKDAKRVRALEGELTQYLAALRIEFS
jgi:PAS domain S-box-containing protein